MADSPYRHVPSGSPECSSCGVELLPADDEGRPGRLLCGACFSEQYDLPALLGMISLCAGASTGSMVFLVGGLAISGLAAYTIRRWF